MKVENNREWVVEIFERYGSTIYKLIARQVNNDSDIDDIYQQLFLSLIQGPGLSHDHNILGYLFKATTNHVINSVRLKNKYYHLSYQYAKHKRYRVTEDDPQSIVSQTEEKRKRIKLITKFLPHHEAQAVIGHYIYEHDFPALAKEMRINKRTLSRYICTGLKKIRQLLDDDTIGIDTCF